MAATKTSVGRAGQPCRCALSRRRSHSVLAPRSGTTALPAPSAVTGVDYGERGEYADQQQFVFVGISAAE